MPSIFRVSGYNPDFGLYSESVCRVSIVPHSLHIKDIYFEKEWAHGYQYKKLYFIVSTQLFLLFSGSQMSFPCLPNSFHGPSWSWSYGSWIYIYLCNRCRSPLMLWVRTQLMSMCTTLCNKVCQWLAAGRWFSLVSSTDKTDHHDITEIFIESGVKHHKTNPNQTIPSSSLFIILYIVELVLVLNIQ